MTMSELDESKGADLQFLKNKVFDYIKLRLGDGIVDVEIGTEHLEMALMRTIEIYRARSNNSMEDSYAFLRLVKDQQVYTLPQEITSVRTLFRRTIGSGNSGGPGGDDFEPFEAGFMNTYMLSAGQQGGLLSYELYTQYQSLTSTMFGGHINYTFNPVTKNLTLVRRPESTGEIVLMWTYNMKPEIQLLSDYRIAPWIREYAYSLSKFTLGEARSKFSGIPGPQGGTTLNGAELKTEATAEMAQHIEDLKNYVDGSDPLSFILG